MGWQIAQWWNVRLPIVRLGVRSTATEWIAVALLCRSGKSVHLNCPGKTHNSGFGLPPIAVTKNYKSNMWLIHANRVFLRFRFGDRMEILRDRLEEFGRPFSIDVISGHYILRDRWRNLRDRFGPSKHLKKNTARKYCSLYDQLLRNVYKRTFPITNDL